MKKEQMVGTRLPSELVRELELIEDVEQSDRSTTVRRLLSKAIRRWKLEHYARPYGDGKLTLARAARDAGVSLWEMLDYTRTGKVSAQYDLEDLRRDSGTTSGNLQGRGRVRLCCESEDTFGAGRVGYGRSRWNGKRWISYRQRWDILDIARI